MRGERLRSGWILYVVGRQSPQDSVETCLFVQSFDREVPGLGDVDPNGGVAPSSEVPGLQQEQTDRA